MYSDSDHHNDENRNWAQWLQQVNAPIPKTPHDCTISDGNPCLACERQSKLRDQIEETKKLLDNLLIQEREARSESNSHHDPLHRLPVGIVSRVFRFTLPDFNAEIRPSGSGRRAFTLSAVCQAWRAVALSTPQLWSKVMLKVRREPTKSYLALVEDWLERSRNDPLTIQLFFNNLENIEHDEQAEGKILMLRKFVDLFNKHSTRWETLAIESPNWISEQFTGSEHGAPLLKTLQVILRSESEIRTEFALKGAIPKPNHVTFHGYCQLSHINISWDNVTNATVACHSWKDVGELLYLAPNLVYLRLVGTLGKYFRRPNMHDHHHHVVLQSLQTLHLQLRCSPETYASIFDRVTLPSLEWLSVYTLDPSVSTCTFPFKSLEKMLNRSFPPLIHLFLEQIPAGQPEEALDFVYTLPASVKTIELGIQIPRRERVEDDDNLDTLFSRAPAAAHQTPPQSELLPNLETFDYKVNTQIPWGRILDLMCAISGKQKPFRQLSVEQKHWFKSGMTQPPPLYATGKIRDKSIIRDLMKLKEDGVTLYLPCLVSSQDLLALLEE